MSNKQNDIWLENLKEIEEEQEQEDDEDEGTYADHLEEIKRD